ncbi:exo-alpha-sialidase [Singulisphaera acidiphila]|uniref:BNR/Asp-box repeat protein n=1 Tax=Singulisphaera acidiphila (strain ATCC BAA-1392 / DSM 18658 / VKM B-2454 / MOB10) TaxID=886293 RepID=L0D839_SINAD|nr:exo-alpha-sialidase [Singulisphaera acidiphila]AGA24816.1 BNR/Asp-box repeat protein [Singulisphaera acidiphila DSM 18658]
MPYPIRLIALAGWAIAFGGITHAAAPAPRLELDEATQERCLSLLKGALASDEFWPSMHASEALTLAGHGADVQTALAPKLPKETDDQKRCGLARELARAGDLSYVQVLLDILASPNPHGHIHASESLFKIWQVGDGVKLRQTLTRAEPPKLVMMTAAALVRGGNREALDRVRKYVSDPDGETARIAAWILARTGGASDLRALRAGATRFSDPLTKAYFEHALASLGDADGLKALIRNLGHPDFNVRVYAAEFAPDARAVAAKDALLHLLDDPVLDVRIRAAQALLVLAKPSPSSPTEDISRDVFPATAQNPRYSEGSVLVQRDGSLIYATTEFQGSGSDFAKARIIAVDSTDQGRTWSERRVLQENVGQQNVMSVTLRRLKANNPFDGPIGLFYLVKNSPTDLDVYLRISNDEAKTFGEPRLVTTDPGYHVLNNDRVTVLSTGRILVPIATTEDAVKSPKYASSCYFSDDQGETWKRSRGLIHYPGPGAMEPEVLEQADGRLLMQIRTKVDHIAVSESTDGGESWSEAKSWEIAGPESPATLRRIPSTGNLLLIWNNTLRDGKVSSVRTPLTSALSADEGRTWSFHRNLENDPTKVYAYTSVVFDRGRALLTYYVGDTKTGRISSRFRSVPIAWFSEPSASN